MAGLDRWVPFTGSRFRIRYDGGYARLADAQGWSAPQGWSPQGSPPSPIPAAQGWSPPSPRTPAELLSDTEAPDTLVSDLDDMLLLANSWMVMVGATSEAMTSKVDDVIIDLIYVISVREGAHSSVGSGGFQEQVLNVSRRWADLKKSVAEFTASAVPAPSPFVQPATELPSPPRYDAGIALEISFAALQEGLKVSKATNKKNKAGDHAKKAEKAVKKAEKAERAVAAARAKVNANAAKAVAKLAKPKTVKKVMAKKQGIRNRDEDCEKMQCASVDTKKPTKRESKKQQI